LKSNEKKTFSIIYKTRAKTLSSKTSLKVDNRLKSSMIANKQHPHRVLRNTNLQRNCKINPLKKHMEKLH
jgi:hypothetical protein